MISLSKVFAITNQKGGVGKTTTAINLGASLAANDLRVLVVDSDPQGNATSGLGVPKDPNKPGLYHVLLGGTEITAAIVPTAFDGLSLLSSAPTSNLSTSLTGSFASANALRPSANSTTSFSSTVPLLSTCST
jgi:cellulose biosynthesis protein BcsQ